ncbi:MAG: SlyX family protein, partial [Pseudomonadales bacterium]|nr:SlyX family protein [Pseudomonadales bacterium]
MSEDRIARLEEQIAFQEDVIQKLDGALADQQKQLMEAERKIELMIQQLRKLETNQPVPLD